MLMHKYVPENHIELWSFTSNIYMYMRAVGNIVVRVVVFKSTYTCEFGIFALNMLRADRKFIFLFKYIWAQRVHDGGNIIVFRA